MVTDLIIYLINNKTDQILEKYIFYRKESKTKVDIFPILGRIWSRIRIHIKMKRIRNTGKYEKLILTFSIWVNVNHNHWHNNQFHREFSNFIGKLQVDKCPTTDLVLD